MPEQPAAPQSAARRCLNCGAVLTGRYCANCSQAADVHVPSTGELLHEALEGITHSDSRLWRTLYLLWFKPGRLTQEFVAGRRASYLPPFRLYLVLSILFFLAASFSNTQVKFVQFDTATVTSQPECDKLNSTAFAVNLFGRDWAPRIKHACNEIARDNGANLFHVAVGTAPKAKYAEHLLFFLHVHAFFFSVMTLVVLVAEAAEVWPALSSIASLIGLLLWSLPVYTIFAMRRVFDGSWTRTLVKASALFVAYMVVLAITLAGVFVYAVLQM